MKKVIAINVNAKKVRRVIIPATDGMKLTEELYKDAARFGWKVVEDNTDRGYPEVIDEIERALRA